MTAWSRILGPLQARLRLAIGKGLLSLVNDASALQQVQLRLLDGEVREAVRVQNFGHSGNPPAGSRAVAVAVGANRNHLVVVAADHEPSRHRNLQPGESVLYSQAGDYVLIRNGRVIEVAAGTAVTVTAPEATFNCASKVTLNTPLLEVSGAILAGGNVQSAAQVIDATGSMQAIRDTYNAHQHGSGPTPTPVMS